MNYDAPINISNLKDPNKPEFMLELKCSFMNLTSAQENDFFSTLLSHFQSSTLSVDIGRIILTAIYKFLYQTNRKINFSPFILQLPYSNNNYLSQIFDILYILAEIDPNLFTKEVSVKFKRLIRQNPQKCLTILAILAVNFARFEYPWPMCDLLFSCKNSFIQSCPSEYVTVIITLCKKDSVFLNGRGAQCWSRISLVLKNNASEEGIITAYYGICKLIDLRPKLFDYKVLPYDVIFQHLDNPTFQDSVLSFYLRVPPLPSDPNIDGIILRLINLATHAQKATLILIRLSDDPNLASKILESESWISKGLPTQMSTTQLLIAVMRHRNLRERIANKGEIFTFLANSVKDENLEFFSLVPIIVRRISIDKQFVYGLFDQNVIQIFVKTANLMDETNQLNSMLLLFDTFASVDYGEDLPDFDAICDFVSKIIKMKNGASKNAASKNAVKVAIDFCKFKACFDRFKQNGIDTFLNGLGEEDASRSSRKLRRILNEIT